MVDELELNQVENVARIVKDIKLLSREEASYLMELITTEYKAYENAEGIDYFVEEMQDRFQD